jgi:hypothetical protein
MDDIVKAAMAKWPNVPDCYGWLGLDARGQWWMRDDLAQRAGPFAGEGASSTSKGSVLRHDKLIEFINRNYAVDERGCWFFQNGPQRVFVELGVAPWVWRVQSDYQLQGHTGQSTDVLSIHLDEQGRLFVVTPLGLGLIHSQDMHLAAEAVEAGLWIPAECAYRELIDRHGCVLSPTEKSSQT